MNRDQKPEALPKKRTLDYGEAIEYVEGVDEMLEEMHAHLFPAAPNLMLITAIEDKMAAMNMDNAQMAAQLGCDEAYLESILEGKILPFEFTISFIHMLAHELGYEINTMCLLMGVEETDLKPEIDRKKRQIDEFAAELGEVLFETIDTRRAAELEGDFDQRDRVSEVIEELENLIAKQREDIRFVEELIAGLNPSDEMPERNRSELIHMRGHLERIIRRFKVM